MENLSIKSCIICLKNNGTVPVFRKKVDFSPAEMLNDLTKLEITQKDRFPDCLCTDCFRKLEDAFALINQCYESDKILKNFFKKENESNYSDVDCYASDSGSIYEAPIQPLLVAKLEQNEMEIEQMKLGENHKSDINLNNLLTEDIVKEEPEIMEYNVNPTFDEAICDSNLPKIKDHETNGMERKKRITRRIRKNVGKSEKCLKDSVESTLDCIMGDSYSSHFGGDKSKIDVNYEQIVRKKRVRKIPDKTQKCNQCTKLFRYTSELAQHQRVHSGLKPFLCASCPMKFAQRANLQAHQKRHHESERNFICEVCSKQFISLGSLNQHTLIHAKIKSFKCDECPKAFNTNSLLRSHQELHDGGKNHICKECGKGFSKAYYIIQHMRTVHLNIKDSKCSVCDKTFSCNSNLQAHFRIHTGEKPFACKFCDAKFNQSSPLTRHTQLHIKKGHLLKEFKNEPVFLVQ